MPCQAARRGGILYLFLNTRQPSDGLASKFFEALFIFVKRHFHTLKLDLSL